MNVLDINGLTRLVNKIKTYFVQKTEIATGSADGNISVAGTDVPVKGLKSAAYKESTEFAEASHNQASNTINVMTGYSKPNSTSAISTSDTLNQAIGKLEKGLSEKLDVASIPTKVSDLENDAGYLSNISWNNIDDKPNSFIPSDHNQPSNTITEMTGYTKGNISGDISINDTLNQAIAKLENGLDTKANITDIPDVSNFVSQLELAQELSNKADKSEIPDISDFISDVSWDDIKNKPIDFEPKSHTHDVVNASTNGFMSSTDKTKLDNLVCITVSDDTTMPQSVNINDLWIQIVGNSAIENSETTQF